MSFCMRYPHPFSPSCCLHTPHHTTPHTGCFIMSTSNPSFTASTCNTRHEPQEECPMDRSKLLKADLSRALVVENLIGRTRVRCPHASQHTDGAEHCDWLGPVSERQEHLDKGCEHTLVPCPHDGCEVRVQRRVVSEHAASCEQRVETCERCGEGGAVSQRAQHEEECPMKRVACPLDGCGALNRRKETAEHEAVCPSLKCAGAQSARCFGRMWLHTRGTPLLCMLRLRCRSRSLRRRRQRS